MIWQSRLFRGGTKLSKFHIQDTLQDPPGPEVKRVRLTGDSWYIEVVKHDESTIEVRTGGLGVDAAMLVRPRVSNVIHITTAAGEA